MKTNGEVLEAVKNLPPSGNRAIIQAVAAAYSQDKTGNFYAVRKRTRDYIGTRDQNAPAPQEAVEALFTGAPTVEPDGSDDGDKPPTGGGRRTRTVAERSKNDYSTMFPWVAVVAAVLLLIGYLVLAGANDWWPNDDSTPTSPDPTSTPVDDVEPTNAPDMTATAVPDDNGSGSSGGGQQTDGNPEVTHFARLESLDPSFRSGGWQAWLSAAGVQCETVRDARQPEEETSPSGKISVAGLQVEAQNCHVPWPNIVTTDVPTRVVSKDADSVEHKPDPNNGSVLYANVTVTGPVTIWADGQNWGQFTSKLGFVSAPAERSGEDAASALPSDGCFSLGDLDSRYGIDRGAQGTSNGLLMDAGAVAGAVLRLGGDQISELEGLGWTIQGTNPTVKSAWSPPACRPLS